MACFRDGLLSDIPEDSTIGVQHRNYYSCCSRLRNHSCLEQFWTVMATHSIVVAAKDDCIGEGKNGECCSTCSTKLARPPMVMLLPEDIPEFVPFIVTRSTIVFHVFLPTERKVCWHNSLQLLTMKANSNMFGFLYLCTSSAVFLPLCLPLSQKNLGCQPTLMCSIHRFLWEGKLMIGLQKVQVVEAASALLAYRNLQGATWQS